MGVRIRNRTLVRRPAGEDVTFVDGVLRLDDILTRRANEDGDPDFVKVVGGQLCEPEGLAGGMRGCFWVLDASPSPSLRRMATEGRRI